MPNPRVQWIREERRIFADKRADFYRAHLKSGLVEEVQGAIAKRDSPPLPQVLDYLLVGNQRSAGIVNSFEASFGKLKKPEPGEYHIGRKGCVDSRAQDEIVLDLIQHMRIHERTAASVVRRGFVFLVLEPVVGVGFVVTHSGCGGEQLAYDCHSAHNVATLDAHARSIVESIPPGIATIKDPILRSKANARVQAAVASGIVQNTGLSNEVHPVMITWQNWPDVDAVWCSSGHENRAVTQMRENFKLLWKIAKELGRSPENQFAHTIVYYDPYRLGRINNPRAIFDSLPNELFCVTENFNLDAVDLSASAVGSVRYAGFLDGGHVLGVGKGNGNRHVMILDPDPAVMAAVKQKLLASSPDLTELTRGGETITQAKYNVDTGLVEITG